MTIFWNFLSKLCRVLLSLRYKITVRGLENLSPDTLQKKGGILFLPNHPAHMDPLFLFLLLWPKFRMRPLVIEYIYRLSLLKPLIKLVRALPIPNFDTSVNQLKIKKAQQSIQLIADGLKEKNNFILYPAGRLKNLGKEVLGGSSGAHALVQECPDANIVLIRTTGLWGSSFSRAITGISPDLPSTLWHGIKTLIKNGIFFAPRRKVEITIELEPKDFPRRASRVTFNRFLENWYNRYPNDQGKICIDEPLQLISYAFWKKEIPKIVDQKQQKAATNKTPISSETRSKIYDEIRRILNNPGLEIGPEMMLAVDIGMDSLNIAELITYLCQEFDIEALHPEDIETVQDILEVAETAKTTEHPPKKLGTVSFPKEEHRPPPSLPSGKTIPEAFLNACHRMGDLIACGDDLVGTMSYKKMKRTILVLATHFQKMPESHIAVLLPASIGAYLVILALLFAKKVPVMLNWTLGSRYLDEMMRLSQAKTTIASWRFLERLSHVEFGSLIDHIELLEDIRMNISWKTKLKGAFLSLCPPSSILRSFGLHKLDENHPAVILFTSGTEANPKGVPLSHKNILSNQRAAMQCIELRSEDIIYGILPPFHSFGFSVAGIFPLLAGLRVAFYPDPTDSFALAEGVQRWKISLFCSAPSFLKGLFYAARPNQLDSVRIFISGAEKASQELYEQVEKLNTGAKLVEGYGITECAPILSLNRFNLPPKGVGHLIPNVELCTIHPETEEPLKNGAEGEICVRGPNVFSGYLDNPRTPFIEIDGKLWYRTGDIGYLDKDETVILSGRLKRFTKLGGEMISLGAIEEILLKELSTKQTTPEEGPTLAVCADERIPGKPQIIVFTTSNLDKEKANDILKNAGFSRLVKVSSVHKIKEIPILGTGKTNYRHLQTLI